MHYGKLSIAEVALVLTRYNAGFLGFTYQDLRI